MCICCMVCNNFYCGCVWVWFGWNLMLFVCCVVFVLVLLRCRLIWWVCWVVFWLLSGMLGLWVLNVFRVLRLSWSGLLVILWFLILFWLVLLSVFVNGFCCVLCIFSVLLWMFLFVLKMSVVVSLFVCKSICCLMVCFRNVKWIFWFICLSMVIFCFGNCWCWMWGL